jgi:hypothetical protein
MQSIGFYVVVTAFVLGIASGTLYGFVLVEIALLGLLGIILACGFFYTRRSAYVIALLAIAVFGVGSMRAATVARTLPQAFVPLLEENVTLDGTVVAQPDVREEGIRLTVEISKDDAHTSIIAVAPPHGAYAVGDRVRVADTLRTPEPFAAGGGRTFAYDRFLAKDGVFALIQPARVEVIGRDGSWNLRVLRGVRGSARASAPRSRERARLRSHHGRQAGTRQSAT